VIDYLARRPEQVMKGRTSVFWITLRQCLEFDPQGLIIAAPKRPPNGWPAETQHTKGPAHAYPAALKEFYGSSPLASRYHISLNDLLLGGLVESLFGKKASQPAVLRLKFP
jgi:hypothetical protein